MKEDQYRTRHSLIERVKNPQDEQSWEEFLNSYQPFIIFLLKKFGVSGADVDDFTQKIIVKCWEKIDSYTCSEEKGKFRAWLKTMIRNEIINEQKRNKMIKAKLSELKLEKEQPEENQIDYLIDEEWNAYISKQAWENIEDSIKPLHRDVFKMFMSGKTAEEISKELDIVTNSLYTYKKRVTEKMMLELQKLTEIYDR